MTTIKGNGSNQKILKEFMSSGVPVMTVTENDAIGAKRLGARLQELIIQHGLRDVCRAIVINDAPKRVVLVRIDGTSEQRMTLREYQRAAQRTNKGTKRNMVINGCMGLAGEAGECIDLLKKHLYQGHPLDEARLAEELGDVLWYAACLAEGLGIELEDAAAGNIKKLKARYPNGFEEERSIHRVDRPAGTDADGGGRG